MQAEFNTENKSIDTDSLNKIALKKFYFRGH